MKKIKSLQGQRWFIWAVVISIVVLGGLAAYINNAVVNDDGDVQSSVTTGRADLKSDAVVKLPVSQQASAISLVRNLPEVKIFLNEVESAHATPKVVAVQNTDKQNAQNPYWVVQVSEIQKGHVIDFNAYRVFIKSGKIEKQ